MGNGRPYCNTTLEDQISEYHKISINKVLTWIVETEAPLFGQWTFHGFIGVFAAAATCVAIAIIGFLTYMHASNYTVPRQQKQQVTSMRELGQG